MNRILANVQDPFLIRPSAGVPRRSLVVTLPGETENLHSALNYLITSAPGFIQLLKLLKTHRTANNPASGSSETRRCVFQFCFGRLQYHYREPFSQRYTQCDAGTSFAQYIFLKLGCSSAYFRIADGPFRVALALVQEEWEGVFKEF